MQKLRRMIPAGFVRVGWPLVQEIRPAIRRWFSLNTDPEEGSQPLAGRLSPPQADDTPGKRHVILFDPIGVAAPWSVCPVSIARFFIVQLAEAIAQFPALAM